MKTINTILQLVAYIVLFGSCLFFGFQGKPKEMALVILASCLGLAFLNLHKMKKFKGAGFEAEMKDKIETIIEKETEPRRIEQVGDSEYSLNAYRNGEKTRKVLKALFNPTYTWRYVQGISKESDLPMDEALEALNDLLSKNIVSSSEGDHGTLWCLTAKGRNLFRNIEGASIENKGQSSK